MPLCIHTAVAEGAGRRARTGIPLRMCRYTAATLTLGSHLLQQSGMWRARPSPAAGTQVSLRNRRTDRRLSGAFSTSC